MAIHCAHFNPFKLWLVFFVFVIALNFVKWRQWGRKWRGLQRRRTRRQGEGEAVENGGVKEEVRLQSVAWQFRECVGEWGRELGGVWGRGGGGGEMSWFPRGVKKIKSKILSCLSKKKSEKLTTRPQKRKENLFSPMNLDPPPHKNLFF